MTLWPSKRKKISYQRKWGPWPTYCKWLMNTKEWDGTNNLFLPKTLPWWWVQQSTDSKTEKEIWSHISVRFNFLVSSLSIVTIFKHRANTGFFVCLFVCLFWHIRARAYGSSQARGWIGAVATGLHHSHSNAESESCLWPTPQLNATLDP